VLGHVTKTLH